jgi:hypothetical protein
MGSHCPFGHLKHKLWPNERPGVKLVIWFPTTKSRESTQFSHMHAMCSIPLESSRWGIQLCCRPYCNQRSTHEVMRPQSCESPNSGTKSHLDVALVERRIVYYKGEGGGFPQVQAVVSLMSLVNLSCPWLVLTPKMF